jgi:hypothetical protein
MSTICSSVYINEAKEKLFFGVVHSDCLLNCFLDEVVLRVPSKCVYIITVFIVV